MTRKKNFCIGVYPRDLLADIKGLSADAGFAYVKFWMHHHLHGEPLPPAEEHVPDQDEYFRDLLDMKNVRTWRRARDELVKKARLRLTEDGRFYIGRTMRDLARRNDRKMAPGDDDDHGSGSDNGSTGGGQSRLPFSVVSNDVDRPGKPVDRPGKAAESGEVRPNIGQSSGEVRSNIERSSGEVRPNRRGKSLILPESRGALSCSSLFYSSHFNHEVVVAGTRFPARARGDPPTVRA
jgi:hypothetical protein